MAGSSGVGETAEELERRVVELEEAAQVLLKLFIQSLERFEDGDRGSVIVISTYPGARDPEHASDPAERRHHGHDGHQSQQ